MTFESIELLGMRIASVDSERLLDHVFDSLDRSVGGWIVTANLDIVRRFVLDTDARALYGAADIRVADGMPLVWASQLGGRRLPERVAGSSFTLRLAARAARDGRSLYLLGGDDGAADGCRRKLVRDYPGLRVLGSSNPWISNPATTEEIDAIESSIRALGEPDLLLVGLGSPKQEYAIQKLRQRFPRTWLMGVGITFSFVAGMVHRAPDWMQRTGTEWIHRMAQEPRRLVKRYLIDDLPFAALLFGDAALRRITRR